MDLNIALVSGRLALAPDLERLPDGSQRARLLVCVHPEGRDRFDVLPVVVPPELHSATLETAHGGARVFVAGPLMRRCSVDPWDHPGRVELVADAISFPDLDELHDPSRVVPPVTTRTRVDVEDSTGSR